MVQFKFKRLALIFLLICAATSYLQFKLVRVPHNSKVYNYGVVQCLTDIPKKVNSSKKKHIDDSQDDRMLSTKKNDQQDQDNDEDDEDDDQQNESEMQRQQNEAVDDKDNFKEICYQKDISYSIQLYNKNKQLMLFSIDLTVPISWIKGDKCFITETHRKCDRIQKNYRQQMSQITKKFKQLLKNSLHRKNKKTKKSGANQYALIEGSSQVVKGVLQKTQSLQFITRDSGRLTRFFDLMLLGMFIMGIEANLNLKSTTFINASQISPALNYLCDGAISLRFDENSESSFLKEMAAVAQSDQESYVTIFIGKNNQSMTIGDLSVKNAAHGLSGIKWITVSQDENFGKLANCKQIGLTIQNSESHKQIAAKLPIVLTLSSSTLTIPEVYLAKMLQKFFPQKSCHINETTRYVQCLKLSSSDIEKKQLNFILNQTTLMIPFKNLVIESKKQRTTFNIKSSLDERFIILGQPLFKQYFVVLDYTNNRIGVALQRTKFADAIFDAVSLIRFVVWAFILGTCAICLLLPIQKCYAALINRIVTARYKKGKKKKKFSGTNEEKSDINYTKVSQQNPYQDLNGRIQQVLTQEAEGI